MNTLWSKNDWMTGVDSDDLEDVWQMLEESYVGR